ncbi:MAG: hypothetical protein ISS72_04970 [Candidatus Brocadiae bacterium]|nr:hypothetical protein [Candidatus Brocadiia bacterium]
MAGSRSSLVSLAVRKARELHPDWQVTPHGFGFRVRAGARTATAMLDNIHEQIRAHPDSADALLTEFVGNLEDVLARPGTRSLEDVRDDLFLVARPLELYETHRNNKGAEQLAFMWRVLPDLGIYWAVDCGNTLQYVPRSQFGGWGASVAEVTRIAWENTLAEQANMKVREVPDNGGLAIWSSSRCLSLAHLLYWPRALTALIEAATPQLLSRAVLMSVPAPGMLIVATEACRGVIQAIQDKVLQQHGRLLTESMYLFVEDRIVSKVVGQAGGRLTTVAIEEWGLGAADQRQMSFTPVL